MTHPASLQKRASAAATDPAAYWDGIAEAWQNGQHQLWRQASDAVNRALLARWLPDHSRLLLKTDAFDEAVGQGVYGELAAQAETVVALDISAPLLATARHRCPAMIVVVSDVRHLPFADGSFDTIVSLSTLDHFAALEELKLSLIGLRRLLKAGGCLIVTLDNSSNPLVALRNALPFHWLHRLGLVPYYVGATCNLDLLQRTLAESGFEVVASEPVLHVPRVLAVALARLLDRWRSKALAARYLRAVMAFESLRKWPTRYRTGHFIAVRAIAT